MMDSSRPILSASAALSAFIWAISASWAAISASSASRLCSAESTLAWAAAIIALRASTSSGSSCKSAGFMPRSWHKTPPIAWLFALPESVCRRHLPGRLRAVHRYCSHPLPVHPVDQRQQLCVAHLHPSITNRWPAECCFLQPLGIKTKPGAIPPHDLDPVGPLGAKDIERAIERICPSVTHQTNKTVWTFSLMRSSA